MNESVCSNAANGGHLNVLEWARENGCPWDYDTYVKAASEGHLEVLKWLRENGCPININECREIAKQKDFLNILEYLKE